MMASIVYIAFLFLSAIDDHSGVRGQINPDSWQPIAFTQPEQVHIAIGESLDEIVVTWSTKNSTNQSVVEYGVDELNKIAHGSATLFVDGGSAKASQYIHRVWLKGLQPRTKYFYHCGSDLGWSDEFWFLTVDNTSDWSPHLAVYGDMGNINAKALPYLQKEITRHTYDAILHVGDFAYDMRNDNGTVGDQFMNQIQSIAAYVPYMVCPGNHEAAYNFSHFRERFSMPGPYESLFYSFNLGPVHFISLNTEPYYYLSKENREVVKHQFLWLVEDLKNANLPENRVQRPWIVTYGHRPMYCSDNDKDDCTEYSSRVRTGLPPNNLFGLEKLFYDQGVDLEIWAHEHSYERLWPVFNHSVKNGSHENPYNDFKAPVHVISGSAGCQELTDSFIKNPRPWSAFRSSDYGYMRLRASNATHLHLEQVSIDLGGEDGDIIDEFWIVKTAHGPGSYPKI